MCIGHLLASNCNYASVSGDHDIHVSISVHSKFLHNTFSQQTFIVWLPLQVALLLLSLLSF